MENISQKQRSRIEGIELDEPASSIYCTLDLLKHYVQSVAASGQQIPRIKESLHAAVGSICSPDTICPLIPLDLHNYIRIIICFPEHTYKIHKRGRPACHYKKYTL